MKPETKRFRVELAVNLHAAPIPKTNPNLRVFPMQNALVDLTKGEDHAEPAWYSRLAVGDEISFRLVDISNWRLSDAEPDYSLLTLAELYFNNPVTGRKTNPFTQTVLDWRLSDRISEDQPCPAHNPDPDERFPAWNLLAHTVDGELLETLQLAGLDPLEAGDEPGIFRAFELTGVLKERRDGWVNHFVFDPMMIVSETDNTGDGGGRRR